jgi:hypothetical protein
MPPRRSNPPPEAAAVDAQMRKLEGALASLRGAAREHAARPRRHGGGETDVRRAAAGRSASGSEPLVGERNRTRFSVVSRAIARLRAISRKWLRTR